MNWGHKRVLIEGRLEKSSVKNGYASYGEFIKEIVDSPDGTQAMDMSKYTHDKSIHFMHEFMHFEYI